MHAICETAHAKTDGHLCRLTDGIRRERVKKYLNLMMIPSPHHLMTFYYTPEFPTYSTY